jgi:hypothetical protein
MVIHWKGKQKKKKKRKKKTKRRMRLAFVLLTLFVFFFVGEVKAVLPVEGGGNGGTEQRNHGPWNGGPEPGSVGLSLRIWQPVIDGTAIVQTSSMGTMDTTIDLSSTTRTSGTMGNYTKVGVLGQKAKIYTYKANPNTGGVGDLVTGMPTFWPQEDPFYGPTELAISTDGDGSFR